MLSTGFRTGLAVLCGIDRWPHRPAVLPFDEVEQDGREGSRPRKAVAWRTARTRDQPGRSKARRAPGEPEWRLDGLVGRARWTLWWERAWPLLWVPITIGLVFLTRLLARALDRRFAPGGPSGSSCSPPRFLVSLWPIVRLRRPGRPSALDRLDHDAGAAPRAGPLPRRYPGPRRRRSRDPGALGTAPPPGGATDRPASRLGSPSGHGPARPFRPARRRAAGRRGLRLRRRAGSRHAPLRRLRLANPQAAAPSFPGRRLDRPAALYPLASPDDRPCRRASRHLRAP